MWWNLFQQDDVSLLVHISSSTYRGAVTLKYADWWASHSGNFTQRSDAIRHVEKDYLRRQDRPHFHIRDRYLKKYFPELAIHVINAFQARDKSQKRPLAQREVEHADAPPIRKKSALKKRARAAAIDPPSSYEWWSDFVHACGLPQDAPPDSLLPPTTFNDDSAKEWVVYLSSVLTSLGPRREAFLIQRARSLDDLWSAVSSGARELGLYPQIVIPRPLESVLPSDTMSPCRLAQPETRVGPDFSLPVPSSEVANSPHDGAGIPFDDLIRMMEESLPLINQGALQDITAAVEPTAAETTPFLFVEATSDQGHPLSVSTSIALNEKKSEPPAPSHPLLDPSVPHEETGLPAKPLSQPSDPTVIGQDGLSPVPDPSETNNNGGDSFVLMPLASDLLAAVKKVEVAMKPFEHLSGLDRSPRALEVLEARLAALRSEAVGIAGQISMEGIIPATLWDACGGGGIATSPPIPSSRSFSRESFSDMRGPSFIAIAGIDLFASTVASSSSSSDGGKTYSSPFVWGVGAGPGADASPLPPFLPRADEKATTFTSHDPEPLSFGDQQAEKECILWSETLGKTPFVCLGHFFSCKFAILSVTSSGAASALDFTRSTALPSVKSMAGESWNSLVPQITFLSKEAYDGLSSFKVQFPMSQEATLSELRKTISHHAQSAMECLVAFRNKYLASGRETWPWDKGCRNWLI
ncbi:hypothetical protein Taro_052009 [Colocasia esculenta]|uniref:Uncharacterized protein n=1 Tax=Colocasia esculenta TaxID=4460 RepID=A0A843XIK1_COLES|nr:hypothetical protein [Colocasia esculenta]